MSLPINTVLAALFSDGLPTSAAATKGDASSLPFDAILDDETDAIAEELGEVRDADLLRAFPSAGAEASPGSTETAMDALAELPSRFGTRRLISGKDDIRQNVAVLTAIGKDKLANDSASLLLLAAQAVLQRLEPPQASSQNDHVESPGANTPPGPSLKDQLLRNLQPGNDSPLLLLLAAQAVLQRLERPQARLQIDQAASAAANTFPGPSLNDRLLRSLRAVLVEPEAAPPDDAVDAPLPTTAESSALLADLLEEDLSKESSQADQKRALDGQFSRPTSISPGLAHVDAIRLPTTQETLADQDQGFNQPSTSMGFDRRSSESATVPAIHPPGGVAEFNSIVKISAPSTIAAPAPLPDEAGVVSSIVQTMRLQMREGVGTAIVRLEPGYLGAVSIALRVENGIVTASLHAENPQVRAWMEANEPLLRESLAAQGLSLDRLLVTDERIGDEQSPDCRHQQEQKQHARQRPRRDAATTFEVVV